VLNYYFMATSTTELTCSNYFLRAGESHILVERELAEGGNEITMTQTVVFNKDGRRTTAVQRFKRERE